MVANEHDTKGRGVRRTLAAGGVFHRRERRVHPAQRRIHDTTALRGFTVVGRYWGLNRADADKTARIGGTGGAAILLQSITCARQITYDAGGRGFKSCRARQIHKGLRFHRPLFMGDALHALPQ
ncbi:MAG TPA: hypothetical protein VLC55_00815 [Burkholderiales bacterium]|nr:hypothetical protein [Burkholderiales bacterium]